MNMTQDDMQQLIELIRTISRQECEKCLTSTESVETGTVVVLNANNTVNVQLAGTDQVYTGLVNKSNVTLAVGNVVTIKAKGGKMSNGYVAFKNGI